MGALLGDGIKNENGSVHVSSDSDFIPNKIASYLGKDVIARKTSQYNYG